MKSWLEATQTIRSCGLTLKQMGKWLKKHGSMNDHIRIKGARMCIDETLAEWNSQATVKQRKDLLPKGD
jgi:hypothetical protein